MSEVRRRGVKASRVALERALAHADLPRPTQAALAERIADLEQLDSAPKDLVSRVFREQAVDPQSIERVARALGVDAYTLYQRSGETLAEPPKSAPTAAGSRSRSVLIILVLVLLSFTAGISFWLGPSEWRCQLKEQLVAKTVVPDGQLGILVARLVDDPADQAQRYIADRFLEDSAIGPFVSVISVCDRFSDRGPGDRAESQREIRQQAQAELAQRGAHLLIWGERQGDLLRLHLVSTASEDAPRQLEIGGRTITVSERFLEIPLDLSRPQATLPDLKHLALSLMQVAKPELMDLRDQAQRGYRTSIEWLKASIVADRNLRSSIEPTVDPTRWALVNADLCYKYRLLGDYEGNARHYETAIDACDAAIGVRPPAEFAQQWAALQTNKASAWLRLHAYADSLAIALERLSYAQAAIESAASVVDPAATPQLWAVNRRTLGTILIRLGELSGEADASGYFEQGLAELEAALEVQRPDYQPLDWALTQQNICLALYQHGARLGNSGIGLVREAVTRCEEAARWLSPELSDLNWAMVQNNIAASTATLAQLEGDAAGLAAAAEAFRAAQRVYTLERVPLNWAEVQLNLGELHCNMALLNRDPALLDEARELTDGALEVFIRLGAAGYQRYAENLIRGITSCDREALAQCRCSG